MNNRAPEGSQQASIMFANQSPEWKALISDKVNTHTNVKYIEGFACPDRSIRADGDTRAQVKQ